MTKILNYLVSILFIVIVLISSILFYTNNIDFYSKMHLSNNISEVVNIDYNDLVDVNVNLINYLNNDRNDLNMTYLIDGKSQEFFNSKEKDHMVDVKYLYQLFSFINILCVSIFLFILIYLLFKRDYFLLVTTYIKSFFVFIFVMIVIVFLVLIDFNSFWITLHELFFTNDLWLLNPYTDRMIMMYPLNFFYNIVIRIILMFTCINGFMLLLCNKYKKSYLEGRVN